MNRYGIFISCTWNYMPHLNGLLNSIEKRDLCDVDVHLIYGDFPEQYIHDLHSLSFSIIHTKLDRADYNLREEQRANRFFKYARFEYISRNAIDYDAICLLDADMMIVSSEFMNLFDLVCGADKLIGCNEKYKWTVCKSEPGKFSYILDGAPIFPEPRQLRKFHCSVPIICDYARWEKVFDFYIKLVSEGHEIKDGAQKSMGDMFSWNCAVAHEGMEDRLILFPMETMTQVHATNTDPNRRVINHSGFWQTDAGDPVYTLHGRVASANWEEGLMRVFEKNTPESEKEKRRPKVQATLNMIKKEWYDLNYNGKLRLTEYVDELPHWIEYGAL
jgi:hypothetical protein